MRPQFTMSRENPHKTGVASTGMPLALVIAFANAVAARGAGTAVGKLRGNPSTGTVVKAKEYMDYEVKNLNGDKLGEVKDLAVDLSNGTIHYAVIGMPSSRSGQAGNNTYR